jgi:hypothetical protein
MSHHQLGQEHLAELTRIALRRLDFQLIEELDLFIDIIEFLPLIPLLRTIAMLIS